MLLGSLGCLPAHRLLQRPSVGETPACARLPSSKRPALLCSCALSPLNGGEDEPLWPGSKPEQDLGSPHIPSPWAKAGNRKPARKGSRRCHAVATQLPPACSPHPLSPAGVSETSYRDKRKARAWSSHSVCPPEGGKGPVTPSCRRPGRGAAGLAPQHWPWPWRPLLPPSPVTGCGQHLGAPLVWVYGGAQVGTEGA